MERGNPSQDNFRSDLLDLVIIPVIFIRKEFKKDQNINNSGNTPYKTLYEILLNPCSMLQLHMPRILVIITRRFWTKIYRCLLHITRLLILLNHQVILESSVLTFLASKLSSYLFLLQVLSQILR